MICKITSKEDAVKVLTSLEGITQPNDLVFDMAKNISSPHDIPLVVRKCNNCKGDFKYIGPNIWGRNFDKVAVYCSNCGCVMDTIVEVSLAIQGDRVIERGYFFEGAE